MRRLLLALAAALSLAASDAAQAPAPAPATPAPSDLTVEQFLGQRGWSAVQLRENAFSQLETDVVLNGEHRLRVQISTSFSKTIFDEKVVKDLGLAVEPTSIEISGANKQRLGTVQLSKLSFGDTSVGPVTIFTADLGAFVSKTPGVEPAQGMIGSDLLNKYQAVLEIPTSKLYLRVR